MVTKKYSRPLPPLRWRETREFWSGCKKHQLLIQKCKACGIYRHYPVPFCHVCHSADAEWTQVSGKGRIYSWTVVPKHDNIGRIHPAFAELAPYVVVLVELDDAPGIKMVSN